MSSIFSNIEAAMNGESISEKVKLVQRTVPRKPVNWLPAKECHPFVQDLLKKQSSETNDKKKSEEGNKEHADKTEHPGLRGRKKGPISPPRCPQKKL